MRPKFKYSDLSSKKFPKADIHESGVWTEPWMTPEKIPVKNFYEKEDLDGIGAS